MPDSEPPRRTWRCHWRREFGYWCAYLIIAIYSSWPLSFAPASTISIGFENEATVPLLNVWTLWWNADRAAVGFREYWNAPIFYPTTGTFAFSEAQPTMVLMAPIVWLTGSRILAYNVYLLLILSLNGYSSLCLFRRLGHQLWIAFVGGALCQMLPFIWWQSGVVQLTTLFGVVWTIQALLDVFELPGRHSNEPLLEMTLLQLVLRGLRLGGAFCLTYLMCNYWGLFLTLLLVPSSIWLWDRNIFRLRFWVPVLTGGFLAAAMLWPLVKVQRSLAAEHQWTRDQSWIRDLSAHPRDFLDTPATLPSHDRTIPAVAVDTGSPEELPAPNIWSRIPGLDFPEDARDNIWPLGGGSLKLILAPLGLIAALFQRGRRRWGMFAAMFALLAFGLSLGPAVMIHPSVPRLGGVIPYELLQQYVPGFKLIRSPFRFAFFVQLAVVWLSVEALDLLNPWRWWKRPLRQPPEVPLEDPEVVVDAMTPYVHPALRTPPPSIAPLIWQCSMLASLIVGSLLLTTEVWPPRQSLYHHQSGGTPTWIMWLRENTQPDEAVVCLPFPTGYTVGDYQETSLWMYWGTMHGRPLVNGYSGFFPQHFVELKEKLQRDGTQLSAYPWDSEGLKDLNSCQARHVVVKRTFATRDDVWQHPLTKFRWAWVTGDEEHQLDVYEIQPGDPE